MSNNDQRARVTVEDLLHLKRAERPPAEFWNRFEVELRQKQLAALLQRRPWWQGLVPLSVRGAYLPLGAAAGAVALTMFSVKYFSTARPEAAFEPVPVASHAAHLRSTTPTPHTVAVAEAPDNVNAAAVVRPRAALSERLPESMADLTPWSAPRAVETPSAKSIAASMARLERTEPDLADVAFDGAVPEVSRVQTPGGAVVEFAGISTVASKRSRLLAELDGRRFAPEPQAPEMVRERLARRLADSDFSDSFSRIGLKDGGVSLKF